MSKMTITVEVDERATPLSSTGSTEGAKDWSFNHPIYIPSLKRW